MKQIPLNPSEPIMEKLRELHRAVLRGGEAAIAGVRADLIVMYGGGAGAPPEARQRAHDRVDEMVSQLRRQKADGTLRKRIRMTPPSPKEIARSRHRLERAMKNAEAVDYLVTRAAGLPARPRQRIDALSANVTARALQARARRLKGDPVGEWRQTMKKFFAACERAPGGEEFIRALSRCRPKKKSRTGNKKAT